MKAPDEQYNNITILARSMRRETCQVQRCTKAIESRIALWSRAIRASVGRVSILAITAMLIACGAPTASAPYTTTDLPYEITTLRQTRLSFESGIVANNPLPFNATRLLAAPLVRVEFPIGADPGDLRKTVDELADQGSSVLLLAGFWNRIPTEEQARSLGRWAKAFGPASGRDRPITTIEFGNETSYGSQYGDDRPGDKSYNTRARIYALRASTAAAAIRES